MVWLDGTAATEHGFAEEWAPYRPDAQRPWDLRLAAHLYRRAGFGADWPTLQRALREGPQRTVARLLRPAADVAAFHRSYDQLEADSIDADSSSTQTLRQWWLRRMLLSPHPLLEKMTLFWHSHFGVSGGRVGSERLMQRHLGLLRRHALGSFRELLEAVCRDPAVLLNAGVKHNPRTRPNAHFARVVLDDYTLGPGVCSPTDVREAARAFTGAMVLRGEYRERAAEHDPGPKRFLGQEGPLAASDVLRIALAQPAAAQYLVRKLYAWLISETVEPAPALIEPLVRQLAQDYDVGRLLETMLRSRRFFSPAAYRQRIKGPVEFAIGIARGLGELVPTGPLGRHLDTLGQSLCQPPTVHGWAGGTRWLNRVMLIERSNAALTLLAPAGVYEGKLRPGDVARRQGFAAPASAVRFLVDLFVQGDLPAEVLARLSDAARRGGDADERLRRLTHAIVTLPEFHLA
jgi:uncharacterized protein (DUF1800 family)